MSTSSESPGLSGTASGLSGPGISGAASQTTRSSSACPTTSARPASPSAVGSESTSRSPQTSPTRSYSPASTTVSASLSRTVWPLRSSSVVTAGETATRIRRPEVNTSTVSSGNRARKTP